MDASRRRATRKRRYRSDTESSSDGGGDSGSDEEMGAADGAPSSAAVTAAADDDAAAPPSSAEAALSTEAEALVRRLLSLRRRKAAAVAEVGEALSLAALAHRCASLAGPAMRDTQPYKKFLASLEAGCDSDTEEGGEEGEGGEPPLSWAARAARSIVADATSRAAAFDAAFTGAVNGVSQALGLPLPRITSLLCVPPGRSLQAASASIAINGCLYRESYITHGEVRETSTHERRSANVPLPSVLPLAPAMDALASHLRMKLRLALICERMDSLDLLLCGQTQAPPAGGAAPAEAPTSAAPADGASVAPAVLPPRLHSQKSVRFHPDVKRDVFPSESYGNEAHAKCVLAPPA